jgi:hypothetical protein
MMTSDILRQSARTADKHVESFIRPQGPRFPATIQAVVKTARSGKKVRAILCFP